VTKGQIKKIIQEQGISFFYLQFSDLLGQFKNVVVHVDKLDVILEEGLWFDGSSVEGLARISESDMYLRPDLVTFSIIPWSNKQRRAARLVCDIYKPSGRRADADPRFILQKVLKEANEMGYDFKVGPEFEFYLFEREKLPLLVPHDYKSYFDYTPHSRASMICESSMKALSNFGIKCEMHHHEVGKGQHEVDIRYDDALKSADNIMTLKMVLKAYTSGTELKASWMPKPIENLPGNGLHVHQSIWKGNRNLFYSARKKYCLSSLASSFLAGQLLHAKALSSIASPTINSYKRLVPGYEAPVYICWGQNNRSALIRIPRTSKSKVESSTRLEYRAPDPSANPYIVFAALLKAGIDGIKKKLVPPAATEDNVYHFNDSQLLKNHIDTLPDTLGQAIEEFEKDDVISSIFGSQRERILEIRKQEWKEYARHVTSWEVKRYL
jgi:glutamine synthetase